MCERCIEYGMKAKATAEENLNTIKAGGPKSYSFSDALCHIKEGVLMTRMGWNGKNMYVTIQKTTPESKMTRDYLYIKTADNDLIPWVISNSDVLANDWIEYDGGRAEHKRRVFEKIQEDIKNGKFEAINRGYTDERTDKQKMEDDMNKKFYTGIDYGKPGSDHTVIAIIEVKN